MFAPAPGWRSYLLWVLVNAIGGGIGTAFVFGTARMVAADFGMIIPISLFGLTGLGLAALQSWLLRPILHSVNPWIVATGIGWAAATVGNRAWVWLRPRP